MESLSLIEDVRRKFRNDRGVLFIEEVTLAEAARRIDDLIAVQPLFLIPQFRNDLEEDAVFQAQPGNDNLRNTRLLHDLQQDDSCRYDHISAIRTEAKVLNAFLEGGSTQLQMDMVANVTRYHRKSAPKMTHKPYEDLPPKQRLTVSKLAAVLRLADALDHEHRSTVESVEVEYKRPKFTFRLKGKGDMLLEKWALSAKRDMFESVFDANVVVEDLVTDGSGKEK